MTCQLKKNKNSSIYFSPSQGPCCDSSTCQFINKSENFVCQNSKPCVDELYCQYPFHQNYVQNLDATTKHFEMIILILASYSPKHTI
jgi:hypothetical protein